LDGESVRRIRAVDNLNLASEKAVKEPKKAIGEAKTEDFD